MCLIIFFFGFEIAGFFFFSYQSLIYFLSLGSLLSNEHNPGPQSLSSHATIYCGPNT